MFLELNDTMFSLYPECSPILTIISNPVPCFDNCFVIPNLKASKVCNDTNLSNATNAFDFHRFLCLVKICECFPKMHVVLQLSRRIQFPSSRFSKSHFIVWKYISTCISNISYGVNFLLSSCKLNCHIIEFSSSTSPSLFS